MILAGAVVIRELMRAGGYRALTVSENSLLAGMAATINETLDGKTPTIAWTPSLSTLKIGGELLACPRGSGSKLAIRGRQRGEKALRHATATDVQRARSLQRKDAALRSVYARHELRGAAARIRDDDALAGKVVRHAKKRQARLDLARNHLWFEPQLAQAVQQQGGIGRIARGTRARGADARGPKGTRLIHKHTTRFEHTLNGLLAKAARRVHALAQVGNLGMLGRFHDRPGLGLRQQYNDELQKSVDKLLSEEGIKDAASEDLGLVMPGEKKIDVLGLDDDSDSSSSKKSSNAKKASEVAKEIEEVGKDAPWYIQALDMLFGFNGVEGQTVVSNGK